MRLLFITNLCPHYMVGAFEALARKVDVQFLFHSEGQEWYRSQSVQRESGDFPHEYLKGVTLTARLRLTPGLVRALAFRSHDVVIKGITGRFVLPISYFLTRLRGLPFVLWTGIWHHPDTFFHRLTFPLVRWLYRNCDAVVTYGDHVTRYLVELGVPRERVFSAHHSMRNEDFTPAVPEATRAELRASLGLGDRPVVLYVGRLTEIKGVDYLIEAMATLGDLAPKLLLVGQGELRESLGALAKARSVDAVFHTDHVPNKQLHRYYSLASVVVLPSVTTGGNKETWGFVVNEAMNQGVPVVATDAVGAAAGGLVRDGHEGFVVPERDGPALSAALRKLLESPELAARLGQAARARVATFTHERMAAVFLQAAEYAAAARRAR